MSYFFISIFAAIRSLTQICNAAMCGHATYEGAGFTIATAEIRMHIPIIASLKCLNQTIHICETDEHMCIAHTTKHNAML